LPIYYQSYFFVFNNIIAQHEVSQRESKTAKSLLEKLQSVRDTERRTAEQSTRDLEARLLSMTAEKNAEAARYKDAEQRCTHYRILVEGLRNEVEALKKKQKQQQESLRNAELSALKSSNIDHQNDAHEKMRLASQLENEMSTLKEKHKRDLAALERRLGDENQELRSQVTELREYGSQLERTLEQGTAKRSQLLETVRNTSSVAMSQLEAELAEEHDRFNALAKVKM